MDYFANNIGDIYESVDHMSYALALRFGGSDVDGHYVRSDPGTVGIVFTQLIFFEQQ